MFLNTSKVKISESSRFFTRLNAARQADDVSFMHSLTDVFRATSCASCLMIEVTEDAVFSKAQECHVVRSIYRDLIDGLLYELRATN
ncbi:MAG: hypothetical protein ACTHNN_04385 [Xanthobacteraceae bacterium]